MNSRKKGKQLKACEVIWKWCHLHKYEKNVDVDTIKKRQIICNLNLLIQAITKRTLRECQLMNVCSISDIFKQL